jgi:endonuclease G
MHLRKIAVGLSALVLLSTGAEARSLLDLLKPPTQHQEHVSRSGSISQNAALELYSNKQKQASFDGCADLFPAAKPINMATVPATMKPLALCSDNFAVLYSQTSKTPLVVVERLNSAQLQDAKGEERTNQFYPDPRIPKSGRAELSDYRSQHPAVDRGHQSPAADAPNPNAMAQSFALSNMVPQDPTNNRKIWSKVEPMAMFLSLPARSLTQATPPSATTRSGCRLVCSSWFTTHRPSVPGPTYCPTLKPVSSDRWTMTLS